MDSLLNKRNELKNLISENDPDIILLNEIYPKKDNKIDPILEFDIPGYSPKFNKFFSRGVAIYIKNNIDIVPCHLSEIKSINENLWQLVKIKNVNLLIGCIYRSDSNNKEQSTTELIELFQNALNIKFDKILIMGDFNYSNIDWDNISNTSSKTELNFIESIQGLGFQQIINSPTRHREGQKSNILDFIFTLDSKDILQIKHLMPIGKSDHEVLYTQLDLPKNNIKLKKTILNFKKMYINDFNNYLQNTDWSIMDHYNCQESVDFLYDIILKGVEQFVPKTIIKNTNKVKQPWLNSLCHKTAKKKYLLYKKFLESGSNYYYKLFNLKRQELKKNYKKLCEIL